MAGIADASGSAYQVTSPTSTVTEQPTIACHRPSTTSRISRTLLQIAGMSRARPTMSSRSATVTSAAFCRRRKTIRWKDTGAMSTMVASAVDISATT
jgi:hypothetical protein